MNKKEILTIENINYLLLALLICVPMISFIFTINNIIPITNIMVLILLIIINNKELRKIKINIFTLFYFALFIIMILLNFLIFGMKDYRVERIVYFLVFGILPCISFIIVLTRDKGINTEKLVKKIIYIYAILSVFLINVEFWNYEPGRRMSVSYYMLPLFIAIIIEAAFIDKKEKMNNKIIKYIIYTIIFYKYIYFYLVFASRGAIVAIVVCLFICFITTRKTKIKKILYFIAIMIVIMVLIIYMEQLLSIINTFLNSLNIYSRTLERTLDLIRQENEGNGRDEIYLNTWNGIESNMILGNGIGEFYNKYGTYPHNVIMQAWYEGGIINMIIVLIPIMYSIYIMLLDSKKSDRKKYLLIFLFSISVVRLMVSYEYWKDNYFWLYMFMIFMPDIEKKERKLDGNSYNSDI